jgi:hypothetical protein
LKFLIILNGGVLRVLRSTNNASVAAAAVAMLPVQQLVQRFAVSHFHPALVSRICNMWMALASCPARQGQQRSSTDGVVTANGLPRNFAHIYVMYLPKHVESCFNAGVTTTSRNTCTINYEPAAENGPSAW